MKKKQQNYINIDNISNNWMLFEEGKLHIRELVVKEAKVSEMKHFWYEISNWVL